MKKYTYRDFYEKEDGAYAFHPEKEVKDYINGLLPKDATVVSIIALSNTHYQVWYYTEV